METNYEEGEEVVLLEHCKIKGHDLIYYKDKSNIVYGSNFEILGRLDENKIISDDNEMGIHLELVSNKVTREKFIETVKEGFGKASHGSANDKQIKKFMEFFKGEFKDGDKIYINYSPIKGVLVTMNGKELGSVTGLEFKKALFSIWLGTKPADSSLKKGMLGKV